jgi:CHAT domain-containing protein
MADMYYLDFLYENARLQWLRYKKSNDPKYLFVTIKQLETCTEFGSKMKVFFSNYSAKKQVAIDSKKAYSLMMEAKYELLRTTNRIEHKERAFQLSQQYNSFALREQMNEKNALQSTIKNQRLISKYLVLKRDYLDVIQSAWSDTLSNDMFTVAQMELKFKKYSDSLEKVFPKFKQYKAGIPIVKSGDVQKSLKTNEAFLSYYLADSSIFVFVITREKFELIKINKSADFEKDVKNYFILLSTPVRDKTIVASTNSVLLSTGNRIYRNLFNGISLGSAIKSLIIVPDGVLYHLPFDALVKDAEKDVYSKDAYLIASYDVHYLYYSAQLIEKSNKSKAADVLALGLEYDKYTLEASKDIKKVALPDWLNSKFRSEEMAHLYFSDDEAISVTEIYPGTAYVNQKAIPESFINNAKNTAIIHISAHSYVDYDSPEQSAIILTKKDSTHNNLLTSEIIESLSLSANLVTLSSCNSSSGVLAEGEGVSSLTKSFFGSGCKALIGSQWSVSDQVSSIIMKQFYTHLSEGKTISEALRKAKLDILDVDQNLVNPGYLHPTYWAAWTLYGSDSQITEQPKTAYLWLISILVFCALLVSYLTHYRDPRTI